MSRRIYRTVDSRSQGYAAEVVRHMLFDARHFAYWIGRNAYWDQIDREVIERFACHDCSCPRAMSGVPGDTTVSPPPDAFKFLTYLAARALSRRRWRAELDERLTEYCHWLSTARGLSSAGIKHNLKEVQRWYSKICDEGATSRPKHCV